MNYESVIKLLSVSILSLGLVACGQGEKEEVLTNGSIGDNPKVSQIKDSDRLPDGTEIESEHFSNVPVRYEGQIDSTSIEVFQEGEPRSYRIEDLNVDFSGFQKGEALFIDYVTERLPSNDGEIVVSRITNIYKESVGIPTKEVLDEKRISKELVVFIEGMKEKRKAFKYEGIHSTFDVFLLEGFTLITEGEDVEKIVHEEHTDYYAEVKVLDDKVSLEKLKKDLKKELEVYGDLQQTSTGVMGGYYDDSELFLLATKGELTKDGGEKVARSVLIKEINNKVFLIKINAPIKELSEGMEPGFVAMLKTLN